MPTLSISKTYRDGDVLFEADLDSIKSSIETFINTTKLDDDNIQDNGITGSTKLIDSTITSAKFVAESITATLLDTTAVTTAKIGDSAVTTAKINDLAVTTDKINDLNVTTAKLATGAATTVKKQSPTVEQSAGTGASGVTVNSTSFTLVDNVSITTTGGPLFCLVGPKSGTLSVETSAGGTVGYQIIADDGVNPALTIAETTFGFNGISCACIYGSAILPAATYTVTFKAKVTTGTVTVKRAALYCVEII